MKTQHKYRFEYTPNKDIPIGLIDYMKMVVRRNPVMWPCMLLMDIIHGIRYPISFILMGWTIDLVIAQGPNATITPEIWTNVGLIFAALFIGEMAHAWPHYIFFDWMRDIRPALRTDLLARTMDHSFTYFQNEFAGALARKISEGVDKAVEYGCEEIRWQIFLPLISMGSSAIIIFSVSAFYGALLMLFVFLVVFPVILKIEKLTTTSKNFADIRSQITGQLVDSLTNIAAVKSFAHEALELEAHAKVAEREKKAWHKMLRAFLNLDNYRRATLVIFGGGMMVVCLYGWQYGLITPGEIATIMGVTFSYTANVWTLSFGIINITASFSYLNDALQKLVTPIAIKDKDNASALKITKGEIKFDHIDFKYQGESVFEDLNITLQPGKRYGLVGASGAGKSTFINLLQRFFDVQNGQILIDGQAIKDVTQQSLRRQIAVIPQDTALFHRSLMENIRYGQIDASDEAVIEAARRAFAHDFIEKLPQQYDTMVGERGVKLSGGQRQRIAIARAILKDAPILILDEATSALDSESEKVIQDSLHTLMTGKTVIAIAHRLSTIAELDELIIMENGKIIEQGTHDDLLSAGGHYAKLWAMQSGGFVGG